MGLKYNPYISSTMMGYLYLAILLPPILIQAVGGKGVCGAGESCVDAGVCPEYIKYKSLTGKEKKVAGLKLIGKVCNRGPDRLCCRSTECGVGEECVDKQECAEYIRYKAMEGKERLAEAFRLKGKVCGKARLCCRPSAVPGSSAGPQRYPPSFLPSAGECGVSSIGSSSVVHGEDAALGEFPWAALLRSEKRREEWDNTLKKYVNSTKLFYHCGGTLINTWYVLTAAHCHTYNTQIVEVVLGESDILTDPDCPPHQFGGSCNNPKVQRLKVAAVIVHHSYESSSRAQLNDIALVRVKTEVKLNRFVQLACLPLPEYALPEYFHSPDHTTTTVVGWGTTANQTQTKLSLVKYGVSTTQLQKGEVPIQPLDQCKKSFPIQPSQLCAGGGARHVDSCKGDSGGGLFLDSGDYPGQSSGNIHVQVGIVSFGAIGPCGDSPAVYTKVDQFIPWIRHNINKEK